MQAAAKAVLVTILVSVCMMLFINFIYFFPWYMRIITETFHLSQAASNDNYIRQFYYDDTLERLKESPIFRELPDQVEIIVLNENDETAVGHNDPDYYADKLDSEKPYLQRGKQITVEIRAEYPLAITLWGHKLQQTIPVSFKLTATGLKHYKDLPMEE